MSSIQIALHYQLSQAYNNIINRNWKDAWNKLNKNDADFVSMVSSDELINRNWKNEWNKLNKNNADFVSMVSSDELINRNWKDAWNKLNKNNATMSAWYPVTSPSIGIGRMNGTSSTK